MRHDISLPSESNTIGYVRLHKHNLTKTELSEVTKISDNFYNYLCRNDIKLKLINMNKTGAGSQVIQEIFIDHLTNIGFKDEKKGLFNDYQTPGLRPDYYLEIKNGGIILEVERGKTIRNNMDLLDIWKCHICKEANHLFLVVPLSVSHTPNIFNYVVKRAEAFFNKDNYVNIDSISIFGY